MNLLRHSISYVLMELVKFNPFVVFFCFIPVWIKMFATWRVVRGYLLSLGTYFLLVATWVCFEVCWCHLIYSIQFLLAQGDIVLGLVPPYRILNSEDVPVCFRVVLCIPRPQVPLISILGLFRNSDSGHLAFPRLLLCPQGPQTSFFT